MDGALLIILWQLVLLRVWVIGCEGGYRPGSGCENGLVGRIEYRGPVGVPFF